MIEWNYRVVRIDNRPGFDAYDTILEVHYNDRGRPCAYAPVVIAGADVDGLRTLLDRMEAGLELPVLSVTDDF